MTTLLLLLLILYGIATNNSPQNHRYFVCSDHYRICEQYAKSGYCFGRVSDYDQRWVRKYCSKSCNLCNKKSPDLIVPNSRKDESILPSQQDKVANLFPQYGTTNCESSCGHILTKNNIPKSRVLEGESTPIESNPWYAMVMSKFPSCEGRLGDVICTGLIISKKWALTSAHCVTFLSNECSPGITESTNTLNPKNITIRVGIGSVKSKLVEVDEIMWDDLYDARHRQHVTQRDLALLKLNESLEFSEYIGWACIPNNRLDLSSPQNGNVSGYGLMKKDWWQVWKEAEYPSPTLRTDKITIDSYSPLGFYTGRADKQILAIGDSGAGFEINSNGVYFIYGIFSAYDAAPPLRTYFTALDSYCDRLLTDTKEDVRCVDPTKISRDCYENQIMAVATETPTQNSGELKH